MNFKQTTITRPKPHPLKREILQRGISIGTVAQFAGKSYPHILNQLNGIHRMMPETEAKIRELIKQVEAGN